MKGQIGWMNTPQLLHVTKQTLVAPTTHTVNTRCFEAFSAAKGEKKIGYRRGSVIG